MAAKYSFSAEESHKTPIKRTVEFTNGSNIHKGAHTRGNRDFITSMSFFAHLRREMLVKTLLQWKNKEIDVCKFVLPACMGNVDA